MLRRLSVFAGGFTLEAAEAVCGEQRTVKDVFAAVSGLVDKSLVQVEGDERRTRYGLLETVRACAADRLAAEGETAAIATRHRDWYVEWAEHVLPELTRKDQLTRMVVWSRSSTTFAPRTPGAEWTRMAALRGSAPGRGVGALPAGSRAPGSEGREWLSRALARGPTTPSAARARALTWSGDLECQHGDAEVGRRTSGGRHGRSRRR